VCVFVCRRIHTENVCVCVREREKRREGKRLRETKKFKILSIRPIRVTDEVISRDKPSQAFSSPIKMLFLTPIIVIVYLE